MSNHKHVKENGLENGPSIKFLFYLFSEDIIWLILSKIRLEGFFSMFNPFMYS